MLFNEINQTDNTSNKKARPLALLISVALSVGLATALAVAKLPVGEKVNQSGDVEKGNQTKPVAHQAAKVSYLIAAQNPKALTQKLEQMAITITHKLDIINSVAAELSDEQLHELQQQPGLKITKNYQVEMSGLAIGQRRYQPSAVIPDFIEATSAHQQGNYGEAVTIGFLDTGLDNLSGLQNKLNGNDKYWGTYDAINDVAYNTDNEANGHGTHVASIAANSDFDINGKIYGVAPNALLVGIKAFDGQGQSTYADLIRGVEWAVTNKDNINLRVLNMSFSGGVHSYYWEDPLNIAIMKAWQAGIVIVVSAGNKGPNPMTIGVPANNPYVITVGAMTDNYTPEDKSDDKIASFSSTGPTVEGHVKPEILAPGGHMSGLMDTDTYIVNTYPEFHDGGRYFQMSGTSQAAGVVSGVAALMLTADPTLTPDDIKCRLIDGAKAAYNTDGSLAYSVFQQGAGVVNAENSLTSTKRDCANKNMDIAMDIAGTAHYYGPAAINANGDIYLNEHTDVFVWDIPSDLNGEEGTNWRNAIKSTDGFVWDPSGFVWDPSGFVWDPSGFVWDPSGFVWDPSYVVGTSAAWRSNYQTDAAVILNSTFNINNGELWTQGIPSVATQSMAVNNWVTQE